MFDPVLWQAPVQSHFERRQWKALGWSTNIQTLIPLKSAQDIPSVCGYTVTDLFYQQPDDFFHFSSVFFLLL